MMLEKHKWTTGNEDILLQFDIKEVRLGYMRIRDKNGGNEGTMIPVWGFSGKSDNPIYRRRNDKCTIFW